MTALNFHAQFADKVQRGKKRQSIRALWKDGRFPYNTGRDLQLYTGMRTKKCRKLGDAICTSVIPIEIYKHEAIMLGKREFQSAEERRFIKDDGFDMPSDFYSFFSEHYGLPFSGMVIRWVLVWPARNYA